METSVLTKYKRLLKYHVIKYIFSPVSSLGMSVPLLGGKSVAELIILTGSAVLAFAVTVSSATEGSGRVCDFIGLAVVLLALRNNILTLLFDISWDQSINYHKFCGVLFLLCSAVHTYLSLEHNPAIVSFRTQTGLATLVAPLVMGAAFFGLKNIQFESFYGLHVLGYMTLVPAAFLHNAKFTAYSLVLYLLDMLLRYVVTVHHFKADFEYLAGDVVRLSVPNTFEFESLQYAFIMVPEVSYFQFHPFSFSTSPEEKVVKFHIRALGDWTRKLKQAVVSCPRRVNNKVRLDCYIEGPYGRCAIPVSDDSIYSVVLLISGGVGITPAQSLYNDLYFKHRTGLSPKLKRVHFVWSVRGKNATAADTDPNIFESDAVQHKQQSQCEVSVHIDSEDISPGNQSLLDGGFSSSSSSAMSDIDVAAAMEAGASSGDGDDNGDRVMSLDGHRFENFAFSLPLAFQPPMCPPDQIQVLDPNRRSSNPVDLARFISSTNANNATSSPLGDFLPRDSGIELRHGSNCNSLSGDQSRGLVTADFVTEFYMTPSASEVAAAAAAVAASGDSSSDRGSGVAIGTERDSKFTIPPRPSTAVAARPDIPAIFASTIEYCKQNGCQRVAVVVCGPSSMVCAVHDECVKSHRQAAGLSNVVFDLHVEEFCI